MDLAERLAGGVWGHLVGDAMGVPYEFRRPGEIGEVRWGEKGSHHQPPGTWSDDGGLMLALLDSLLQKGFDLEDQGQKALEWWRGKGYKAGERFDIGNTTQGAMERLAAGVKAEEAGGLGEKEQGNGSLMRILPIALVGWEMSSAELARQAMQASGVTHRHLRARVVCALYALIAQGLLKGQDWDGAMSWALAGMEGVVEKRGGEGAQALGEVMAWKKREGSGYVVDSFWSGWDAARGASSYRETVKRAIEYGNDTDTTACVAGGLAGVHWGVGGIPEEWRLGMRGRAIVEGLVTRLLAVKGLRGQEMVETPREL